MLKAASQKRFRRFLMRPIRQRDVAQFRDAQADNAAEELAFHFRVATDARHRDRGLVKLAGAFAARHERYKSLRPENSYACPLILPRAPDNEGRLSYESIERRSMGVLAVMLDGTP